jgi:hypothetical protein
MFAGMSFFAAVHAFDESAAATDDPNNKPTNRPSTSDRFIREACHVMFRELSRVSAMLVNVRA